MVSFSWDCSSHSARCCSGDLRDSKKARPSSARVKTPTMIHPANMAAVLLLVTHPSPWRWYFLAQSQGQVPYLHSSGDMRETPADGAVLVGRVLMKSHEEINLGDSMLRQSKRGLTDECHVFPFLREIR